MFHDRQEAGQRLAAELSKLGLAEPVVLALPRGGVPVAIEIAGALKAPLDLVIVRKVGAPGNPELAAAAIVDGNPPDIVLNYEIVEALDLDEDDLRVLIDRERPELARRRHVYLGERQPLAIVGKTAIIADDGMATGATMKVAIQALRRRSPRLIVVAVPVAPSEVIAGLSLAADRVVCLSQPTRFLALSYHYRTFRQLEDEDVLSMLRGYPLPGSPPPLP